MLEMEKFNMDFKNVWITGDLHGDYLPIRNFYVNNKDKISNISADNLLILLGDVGANYFLNKRDDYFKEKISRLPFTLFCIRGNHEERPTNLAKKYPTDWHQEVFCENLVWIENKYPKILYALDEGGEYNINGKSTLVIPGAYSIDKDYRIANQWSWFPDEQLSVKEQNDILNNLKQKYDYILSHTCPYNWEYYINDLFLSVVDQSTVDKTMEEFLDRVAANTKWKHWYWGHFHDDRDIKEINGTMLFHKVIPFGEYLTV